MLGLFVNTLTADHMYSSHSWKKFGQPVHTHLSQKPKTIFQSFIASLKSKWNFPHFEKKDSFMAQIFWKSLNPKNVLPWLPKTSCFRTHFGNQRLRGSQAQLKSARHCFYPNFPLIQDKLSRKTSSWIRSKYKGCLLTRWRLITREILATSSNAIILKTKNNFSKFHSIFVL